jgi:PAS domain-containing protein
MKRQSRLLVWSASFTGSDFFDYFTEPQMAEKYIKRYSQKDLLLIHHLLFVTKKENWQILFNGSVYKDDQGNVLGIVIVARDITDQKRSETEWS